MNIPNNSVRLLSFNILYDYGVGEPHSWQSRREYALSLIRFHAPDIFCLQEPLQSQVDDIAENFSDYEYLSYGCKDGAREGQHISLFWAADKFELKDSGKFALTETPETLGKLGWDAKNPRLSVWIKLLQKDTNQSFYVFNTHLDHVGETARQQGALLLCKKADEIAGESPVLICGDFNANPQSQAYKNMLEGGFKDCADIPGAVNHNLPLTYHKFIPYADEKERAQYKDNHRVFTVIDHIFFKGPVKILRHGVLSDNYLGAYPSDHFPKLCDFICE